MKLMNTSGVKFLNLMTKENLLTVITGAICGFFVLYPISDFDIFWHLASGKEILKEQHLLFQDPFSYTDAGQRWYDVHWLFQVISSLIEHTGGLNLLLVFKAALFAVSISILYRSVSVNRSILLTILPIMLFAFAFRYLVTMRPVIFTIFFIALYFYLMENYLKSHRKRYLMLLIPVQIAWANSQGLFMTGIFIYLAYFAGEFINNFLFTRFPDQFRYNPRLSKPDLIFLSLFFPVLLLSVLVNPYAQDAVLFALQLLKNIIPASDNIYSTSVTENMSILTMAETDYTYYFYFLTGMIFLLSLTTIYSIRHLRFTFIFSSLMFCALGYMAQRNLILLVLAFIPHYCWNMKYLSFRIPKYSKSIKLCISVLLCICVAVSISAHYQFLKKNLYTIAPFNFPVNSTEYLKRSEIPGNLFNADRHGGYLIWQLYPEKKVFTDTRLTLRSRAFFAEYLSILKHPDSFFPSLCRKYGITKVIVPLCGTDLYLNLTRYLYDSPDWNLVIADGSEALFITDSLSKCQNIRLSSPEDVDSIYRGLIERYNGRKHLVEESVFHLGNMLINTGNLLSAEKVLSTENSDECRLLLSRIKLLKGETDSALTILEKVISADPGNVRAQSLAASVYMNLNRPELAKRAILSVLIRDPLKGFNILREISEEKKT